MTINIHQIADYVVYSSSALSLLYSVLPTVETFQNYPNFQRRYGLFLNIIKQLAFNLRNKIYPQIQTAGGTQVSDAAASAKNPTTDKQP